MENKSESEKKYPKFSRFPVGFQCISDKSFEWVYNNRKEFVDFTINEMQNATGLFSDFREYCNLKNKEDGSSCTRNSEHTS